MPNPHPVKRTRPATINAETLPPGMTRRPTGLLMYRYTERGQRMTVYGASADECYAKRYAPAPEPVTIDDRTTLAAYLELWLGGLRLRPNTIEEHRRNVERWILPTFGDRVRLADVTRELVELRMSEVAAMTTRYGTPPAPGTIRNAFATLRAAMQSAVDHRRIDANPCARLDVLGTVHEERRIGVEIPIPSELELRRVIRATRLEPFAPLLATAAATGLRQSELLGLAIADVDLDARWIHVRQALRRSDRTVGRVKNAASNRHVPIPSALVPILEAWLLERDRLELLAGGRWRDAGLLFCDHRGRALAGSTVSHWFADACGVAGLERAYRWHDLRHYYASNLLAARMPIERVAKLLGHSSTAITYATYWHVIRDDAAVSDAELAGAILAG